MSKPAIRKFAMSPEMLAALEATGPVKKTGPLHPKVNHAIRAMIIRTLLPTKGPTFRERTLMYSSFAAIKTAWAADHWQKMRAKA